MRSWDHLSWVGVGYVQVRREAAQIHTRPVHRRIGHLACVVGFGEEDDLLRSLCGFASRGLCSHKGGGQENEDGSDLVVHFGSS